MDPQWWVSHIAEVRAVFKGELFSTNQQARSAGAVNLAAAGMAACGNSGASAIAAAHFFGARRVVLLGYDCKHSRGLVHWHGNHPRGLGNAGSLHKWPQQFGELLPRLGGMPVVNCSPETALRIFPRQPLEMALS